MNERESSFGAYLASFRSTWGALTLVATACPLALWGVALTPPWPTENGSAAATLATLAAMVGILAAYFQNAGRGTARRRGLLALLASLPALLIYVACWSSTYLSIPQRVVDAVVERRFVVGFVRTSFADGLTAEDAFRRFELSAWTDASVLAARLLLIGSLLTVFALLTYGFGTLQTLERSSRQADAADPGSVTTPPT